MAHVWSAKERRRMRKTFTTLGDAKAWRTDMLVGLRRGTAAPDEDDGPAGRGDVARRRPRRHDRQPARQPYKPSAIRSYERALRLRVVPELGHLRLSSVERRDVQDPRRQARGGWPRCLHDEEHALAAGGDRSLAVTSGYVAVNPTAGLELAARPATSPAR
jgi:hypothetical protein